MFLVNCSEGMNALFYSTANAQKESAYLAKVCQNGKFGFIDRLGKVVVPLNYDDAGVWGNGLVAVNVGKYTPVEEDATVIEVAGPPGPVTVNNSAQRNSQYKNIEIKKEKKGKWGYCNAAGVLVIPIQFTATTFFSEGMAGVEIDGKWGFIDLKGEILVKPIYDKVGHFSQGLATVVKNGNYGYINQKGEEVIQLRYYCADAFENGYAKVTERSTSKNNNKTATGRLINLKGEAVNVPVEIWPLQEYDFLSPTTCVNTTIHERKPMVMNYWSKCDPDLVHGDGAESFAASHNL
jgi:hypothetical protein